MKQSLKNILDNLSPDLKKAFYSDHTIDTIKDAANLGQLNLADTNKLNAIEGDVMNILLGRARLDIFKETLKSHLNVSDISLTIINKIIQDKVFGPLKNDLNQLRINQPEFTFQKIPQKETITPKVTLEIPKLESKPKKIEAIKESAQKQKPLEITKAEVIIKKETSKENIQEQSSSKQQSPEQIIPKYSFPEPSEVKVEKPVNKIEELKKVVVPKVSLEQQEKIRERLLAAMQKKDVQSEIVEKMKKVSFKKSVPEEKREPLKKKSIGEVTSSKVLGGEGKKFEDEEVFKKTEKEKPYILDVKLKEEKEKKEEAPTPQEPIPYKKYQKKNPFGQA